MNKFLIFLIILLIALVVYLMVTTNQCDQYIPKNYYGHKLVYVPELGPDFEFDFPYSYVSPKPEQQYTKKRYSNKYEIK